MIKIKILSPHKTKEAWLKVALGEYLKRLKPILQLEFIAAKDDAHLLALVSKEPYSIALDSKGKEYTSEAFHEFCMHHIKASHSRLAFIIGGPLGLPKGLKPQALLSLSKLTFTHQMTRLILIEQLYRTFEMERGSPYHKN